MRTVVRNQISKLVGADDALARWLAPRDPGHDNVNRAIWEWGGPDVNVSHHRSHGVEDAVEDYDTPPRRTVIDY